MIYLDNAATSWPKPSCVAQAMTRFLADDAGSPNRAGHRMAAAAERVILGTRQKLADLIGADDPLRIVFGYNCTDALNMAIKGSLRDGDHVITTQLEHNSVLRPLQAMVNAGFITQTILPATSQGCVDPDEFRKSITPMTRLIVTLHASNVTGTIQPVAEIGRIAREANALFLVDAAQSAGLLAIDVEQMCIDLLAFPGHKSLHGPSGTGGLFVGSRAALKPWREGGTGGDSVHPIQPDEYPTRLEAGSPNGVGIAGLRAALDDLNPSESLTKIRKCVRRFKEGIGGDERLKLVGMPVDDGVGVISLVASGIDPAEVAAALDGSFEIAVRPGLHCAPHAHRALGTFPAGTVRISPGPTTSLEEIDAVVHAIHDLVGQLV